MDLRTLNRMQANITRAVDHYQRLVMPADPDDEGHDPEGAADCQGWVKSAVPDIECGE